MNKYRRLNTEDQKQDFLRKDFFRDLSELASGNISTAIYYWLSAICEVKQEKIAISKPEEFDYSFLHRLPQDEIFTLATILQHGGLESGAQAKIFRQEVSQSTLILNRLRGAGMIIENKGVYHVHPLLYRPVVRALKSKNLLQ